jgi:hypothetical protein
VCLNVRRHVGTPTVHSVFPLWYLLEMSDLANSKLKSLAPFKTFSAYRLPHLRWWQLHHQPQNFGFILSRKSCQLHSAPGPFSSLTDPSPSYGHILFWLLPLSPSMGCFYTCYLWWIEVLRIPLKARVLVTSVLVCLGCGEKTNTDWMIQQ